MDVNEDYNESEAKRAMETKGNLLIAQEDMEYLSKVLANRDGKFDLETLKYVTGLIHQARNIAQGVKKFKEVEAKRKKLVKV